MFLCLALALALALALPLALIVVVLVLVLVLGWAWAFGCCAFDALECALLELEFAFARMAVEVDDAAAAAAF